MLCTIIIDVSQLVRVIISYKRLSGSSKIESPQADHLWLSYFDYEVATSQCYRAKRIFIWIESEFISTEAGDTDSFQMLAIQSIRGRHL